MDAATRTGKRAYLRPNDRRRQLLDAASRLFDRGGLTAITMVAVAAEAGASRRLVYDHFDDLASLYEAFFEDRVARYVAAVDSGFRSGEGDPLASALGAFGQLLAVPSDDLRAIRLVIADTGIGELDRARLRLRSHLEQRWLPVMAQPDIDRDLAAAVLWSVMDGLVGLAARAANGEIPTDTATALAAALIARLPAAVAETQTSINQQRGALR